METKKNVDPNEFEGHIKIKGFPSKEALLDKVDLYLEKYKEDPKESLYEIEKETSNLIESSRDIQTQLFYHRLHVALVPDIFYNIRKTEHQDITKIHIEKMINEYINNFEKDNNNNNGF